MKSAAAKQGFAQLVKDLSNAFKSKGWLLSMAVQANAAVLDNENNVSQFTPHLDWISLVTHHFDEIYDELHTLDSHDINIAVKRWIAKGAPSKKLLLGISSAGQSFTLTNSNKGGKGTEIGIGAPGPISNSAGTLAYYEICDNTINNGWSVLRIDKVGTHAHNGNQVVFYDDVNDVRVKAKYIREMGLGGGVFWSLDFDDFRGTCGCGEFPLLTTLSQELLNLYGKRINNCT